MLMTHRAIMRRFNRKMLKEIEAVLHPCPKFGEIEISHRHGKRGNVHFSAWKGDDEIRTADGGRRELTLVREAFIGNPDFYKENIESWNWLMGKEAKVQ